MKVRRFIGQGEHALSLRFARRGNMLFTEFERAPTQAAVLAGPVLDALHKRDDDELRILLFGCSTGAEPYSIASALQAARPNLRRDMRCFDIEPGVIERARAGQYGADDVTRMRNVTPAFIERTFDRVGANFAVKPAVRVGIQFEVGDVLDRQMIDTLRRADVVVAQNFLFHLSRPDATRAFANLCSLLASRSVLVIDGMDLDLRARLTRQARLEPSSIEFERIHDESRAVRGYGWPSIYWGLEPFNGRRADAVRRYSTIFCRGEPARAASVARTTSGSATRPST